MELYGLLTGVPAHRKLHGKDLNLLSYRECPKTKEKVLSRVSFLSHPTSSDDGYDRRSANLS